MIKKNIKMSLNIKAELCRGKNKTPNFLLVSYDKRGMFGDKKLTQRRQQSGEVSSAFHLKTSLIRALKCIFLLNIYEKLQKTQVSSPASDYNKGVLFMS